MADARIRRQIALIAARLMYERHESEYFTAKRKAARQLGLDYRFRPHDLPSNSEIRDQIQILANLLEGDVRRQNLKAMRLAALSMMRRFSQLHPRLIGSVWTGHVRAGSDIDIHLFSNSVSSVTNLLDEHQLRYSVERKRVIKQREERIFTHIHVSDQFNFELTLYDTDKINYAFKSSITGKAIERASLRELEQFLATEYPDVDLSEDALDGQPGRFELYRMLLTPLEEVKQNPRFHPEGDALYHSLQVFELARQEMGYDEEFLLAALLHDVGKAIDPGDHVAAGLAALEGNITARTRTLIEMHMEAHAYNDGSLGQRARKRLRDLDDFDDLMLLAALDHRGRQRGVEVCTIDEALKYIQRLSGEWE